MKNTTRLVLILASSVLMATSANAVVGLDEESNLKTTTTVTVSAVDTADNTKALEPSITNSLEKRYADVKAMVGEKTEIPLDSVAFNTLFSPEQNKIKFYPNDVADVVIANADADTVTYDMQDCGFTDTETKSLTSVDYLPAHLCMKEKGYQFKSAPYGDVCYTEYYGAEEACVTHRLKNNIHLNKMAQLNKQMEPAEKSGETVLIETSKTAQ